MKSSIPSAIGLADGRVQKSTEDSTVQDTWRPLQHQVAAYLIFLFASCFVAMRNTPSACRVHITQCPTFTDDPKLIRTRASSVYFIMMPINPRG